MHTSNIPLLELQHALTTSPPPPPSCTRKKRSQVTRGAQHGTLPQCCAQTRPCLSACPHYRPHNKAGWQSHAPAGHIIHNVCVTHSSNDNNDSMCDTRHTKSHSVWLGCSCFLANRTSKDARQNLKMLLLEVIRDGVEGLKSDVVTPLGMQADLA